MTISEELTRIENAKSDLKTAIEANGITIPLNAKIDTYSTYVEAIVNEIKSLFDRSIASVIIPDGVTTIGDYAFGGCSDLTSVTIPDSVTTIGKSAFENSGLTSVTIPSNVTSIDDEAFNNCSSLASVTIYATTPPTLGGTSVFDGNASGRKIYVPSGSVSTYKLTSRWVGYATAIEAIPNS